MSVGNLVIAGLLALMMMSGLLANAEDNMPITKLSFLEYTQKGEEASEAGKAGDAVKFFIQAKSRADEEGDAAERCLASYNLGVGYFNLCEYGEAMKNFQEAYETCMSHKVGPMRELEILNGITGIYFIQENYGKAMSTAEKAFRIAETQNDSLMCMTLATGMALIKNKQQQFDETDRYLETATRYGASNPESMSRVRTIASESFYMQGKYDELERMYPLVISDTSASDADKGVMLSYMINVWNKRGDYHKSQKHEKMAVRLSGLHNLPFLYNSLSDTYEGLGDFERALACKDSTICYKDSLASLYNRQQMENSSANMEVLRYKIERDNEMLEIRQRNKVWAFVAFICILLVIVAVMMIYNQRQRNNHRHQLMQIKVENETKEKELAEERMRETELIATYQHELMKKEMEKKNIELSATAMFVSSRNKLIADLLAHLSKIQETRDIPAVNNLTKHLNRLLEDNKDEDTFMANFEAANPDFSKLLLAKHPNLIQSDLRFLSYVRMNMTMKEIAGMLNITPESCKRRKIRISQKMGLDTSADLYQYILSLS